jgi:hypothetical protein
MLTMYMCVYICVCACVLRIYLTNGYYLVHATVWIILIVHESVVAQQPCRDVSVTM